MNCNCQKDIEAKALERFKKDSPEAVGHAVDLIGYGFVLQGNSLQPHPVMSLEMRANYPLKKGGFKPRTAKTRMCANFCPFCGIHLKLESVKTAKESA